MEFEKLIYERYSVREFKSTPIEKEKLDKILNAGRIAPTARNSQSQRIKIIDNPAELALVDKCTSCRFDAPLVLLICFDKTIAPDSTNGYNCGQTDAAIVTTHMMLQAWDLGIGSCWVHRFDGAKTRELFNLPDNLVPISMLPLGYASDKCKTSPNHGNRMQLKDLIIK